MSESQDVFKGILNNTEMLVEQQFRLTTSVGAFLGERREVNLNVEGILTI